MPTPTDETASDAPKVPVLQVIPKRNVPRYFMVGDTFHGSFDDGTTLTLRLFFPTGRVRVMDDDLPMLDQLLFLSDDTDLKDGLDAQDFNEAKAFAIKAMTAYEERQQARLGE